MFKTIGSLEEFTEMTGELTPTLVEFGSDDCPYCVSTKTALHAFARKYPKLNVAFVDVDRQEVVAASHVRDSVPVVAVFRGGQRVRKANGRHLLEDLEKLVDRALSSSPVKRAKK